MERDLPINHPNASDYNGEAWNPPRAPYGEDFPEGHPARDGKNIAEVDTADGMRAALLKQQTDLVELASVGSLPALRDPDTDSEISLKPEDLAHIYALRNGLLAGADPDDAMANAVASVVAQGYTAEVARSLIEQYCVPILQQ